ncbi:MAG: sodium-translocating pyrophosphatase [Spirochaetales bacterium]|nr:sodium-translocating pyrophosphatase [Spirochaetales bacterium]
MNFNYIMLLASAGGILALGLAFFKTLWIFKHPVEDEKLKRIGGHIAEGAMAFLAKEYSVLLPFVIVVAVLLAVFNRGVLRLQALSFAAGALCSALAGFIGMKVATVSNSRTTYAAKSGLNKALKVAFSGGTVMGMSVVGLALLGISFTFVVVFKVVSGSAAGDSTSVEKTVLDSLARSVLPILAGFSLGASSIALFSRVGGGIFTKAADVGADLVGKVEADIPEDDPRNPATIADNVGDVAGMGADLFESFVGSIIGCMILGLTVSAPTSVKLKLISLPLILSVTGVPASFIGVFFVKAKPEGSPQRALNIGTFGAAVLAAVFSFFILRYYMGADTFNSVSGYINIFLAMIFGLTAGVIIGILTEFFTGTNTSPVKSIVRSSITGSATNLITGMGVGMLSSFPALVIIVTAIYGSFAVAGLYGIGIAALGMLVTPGIQLAVDAYGPIADNAGGLAVMADFPHEVREITDNLDAVGNTTAAIGKGFAIGSAALTAIILFTSFEEQSGAGSITITSIPVLTGLLFGAVIPYLFSSLALSAVGKAAYKMVEEVRRQFSEHPGILEETEEPDYKKCISISTASALKQMLLPGIIAAATPVLVGFLGGVEMLIGVLTGVTASGVVLAVFMSNSGGAWDNAKKMIEGGMAGGKGSPAHKASIVGDTVGDPFKDTAGPSQSDKVYFNLQGFRAYRL